MIYITALMGAMPVTYYMFAPPRLLTKKANTFWQTFAAIGIMAFIFMVVYQVAFSNLNYTR